MLSPKARACRSVKLQTGAFCEVHPMDRTAQLVPWLRAKGVVWENHLILEEPITRVIAAQDLHERGLVVARVPKAACLTRLTCSDRAKEMLLALQTTSTKIPR